MTRITYAGLRPVLIVLFLLLLVASCGGGGGGGGTTVPTVTNDVATIMNAAKTYDNGTVIETRIYRAMTDSVALVNGSEVGLAVGEAKNFVARAWATLLQPDGSYREEEITAVSGMRFSWALKGLDEGNASLTTELVPTLAQVTVGYTDLPQGGRYDLTVRAEISPQDLVAYVNGRIQAARQQVNSGGSGGGSSDNDDAWWAGAGFLLALVICPSDSAGVKLVTQAGVTPPPPTVTLNISGPAEATVGTVITIGVTSNCPEGWEASWAGGSKSGNGNGSFTIVMPNADLVVTVSDGCGNTKSHTVRLKAVTTDQPPIAKLEVDPTSGEKPLLVHLDASGSHDPDGTIVKYEWDWDGDGVYDSDGTSPLASAVYYNTGIFVPKVRVTDNDGLTAVAAASHSVTVTEPPVDEYDGATASITPQNPVLNSVTGDEQQFVYRIYAADGLTQLPTPTSATVVWDSSVPGSITQTGYFYSVLAGPGTVYIRAVITWTGHELVGETSITIN